MRNAGHFSCGRARAFTTQLTVRPRRAGLASSKRIRKENGNTELNTSAESGRNRKRIAIERGLLDSGMVRNESGKQKSTGHRGLSAIVQRAHREAPGAGALAGCGGTESVAGKPADLGEPNRHGRRRNVS